MQGLLSSNCRLPCQGKSQEENLRNTRIPKKRKVQKEVDPIKIVDDDDESIELPEANFSSN